MSNYGIRVSAEGKDVRTCSDLDTIVNSKYANLKGTIAKTGSLVVGAVKATATIPHNLGFIPMFDVMVAQDGSEYFKTPTYSFFLDRIVWAYADSTNVYISALQDEDWTGEPTITFNYKCFIFNDKGNLH